MTILFVLLISFMASLVRSTLGFGESLIAVPLFLLFLPVDVAVPLSVMLSVVIALIVVIQDHRNIHFNSAKWLIFYAIPGVPIGIVILMYGNENLVKIGLAVLIIAYSLYSLYFGGTKATKIGPKRSLFICGFLSGIFGGAYGLNGPPLVVYGNLRQWTAKHFRATLQAYFLPVSLVSVLIYYQNGLVTTEVSNYFLIALLSTIPAIFLGRYFNGLLKDNTFFRYTYWGLIIISIVLMTTAFQ